MFDLQYLVNEYLVSKCPNYRICVVYQNHIEIQTWNGNFEIEIPENNVIEGVVNALNAFIKHQETRKYGATLDSVVEVILEHIRDSEENTITGLKDYKAKTHKFNVEQMIINDLDVGDFPNSTQTIKFVDIDGKYYLKRILQFKTTTLEVINYRDGSYSVEKHQ